MVKHQYAIVFTNEPPAADIFKDVEFNHDKGLLAPGVTRKVSKPSWGVRDGLILRVGK